MKTYFDISLLHLLKINNTSTAFMNNYSSKFANALLKNPKFCFTVS